MTAAVSAVPPSRPDPALWRKAIGLRLREARSRAGLRLVDVARAARVSPQYLSEVERGRKEASSEVLTAVTGALGMTLVDLAVGLARDLARSATATATATTAASSSAVGVRRLELSALGAPPQGVTPLHGAVDLPEAGRSGGVTLLAA